jgi:hypothetical protein
MPIVVDPDDYSRDLAYSAARVQCEYFMTQGGIRHPTTWSDTLPPRQQGNFGLYEPRRGGRVSINLSRTRVPVKNPGFGWSYTGWKADLTAPGVLAHEVGHHVEHVVKEQVSRSERERISLLWERICMGEQRVSSYEPNGSEAFAEAVKLFILNPDLLRAGRPLRYRFMSEVLCLHPVHDLDWRSVLRNAHPKLISAAQSWIG